MTWLWHNEQRPMLCSCCPASSSGPNSSQFACTADTAPAVSVTLCHPPAFVISDQVPDTQPSEVQPFVDSLTSVPKTGLHNPMKRPDR